MIMNGKVSGNAGVYLRLSRDDGDKLESDSIRNQRELIHEFIKKNSQINLVREYVDDGYSGTNFDRPNFIKMVNDARMGRINCVIVKDLSRLGRNYIDTGRYIEKIFPSLGVRLIAINDNFDSADRNSDESQIIVPFKNLINDAYCRDISLKIRSHLDVKRKNGQFIGSFALYGYQKDPKNKNHLIVDEYASEIVELIFNWILSGYSSGRIADKLNEMGVQPPYDYKRKSGLNYDCGFRSKDHAQWCPESVMRILKNEMYTGKMIQGKRRKINYKVRKSVMIDKDSWMCVDGTHDPIIPKEKFDAVQELLSRDTRIAPSNETVYSLCGYIKCGNCGQNMIRRSVTRGRSKYFYYHCSTYKTKGDCSSHIVNCQKIELAVLDAIQRQICLLDKIEEIIKLSEEQPGEQIAVQTLNRQMEKLMKDIEYYGCLKAKLYKDWVDGVVSKSDYLDLNGRFERSRKSVEETYNKLNEKKKQILSGRIRFQPWVEQLKSFRNITELTRAAVVALLDKVVVYDSSHIEISFLFQDEMNELMKYTNVQVFENGGVG